MEELQAISFMYTLLPIIVIGIFIVTIIKCCILSSINEKEKIKINLLNEINTRIIGIQQNTYKKSDN